MNEKELTQAMRDVIERSSPPPAMDPSSAVEQGRKARRRRTTTWAAVAAVPLVVGVAAGPALLANNLGQGPVDPPVAGTPSSAASTAPKAGSTAKPTSAPTTRKSGDPWPEGQTDRTASAGPRADRAVNLMKELSSAVPDGFTTPNLKHDGRSLRWPQAQYASDDGEPDYWEYMSTIPVQKDNRVGMLLVLSTTPDGKPTTDPCKLAKGYTGPTATCAVVNVDGKKIGVATTNGQGNVDQVAAYRHEDGTVVFLAQAKRSDHPKRPPLTRPIFTSDQLAELVTSAKFKISD